MGFDYFNSSNLAFGTKLTKAFKVLDDLAEAAEHNVDMIAKEQEIFAEFLNRNYIVPRPTNPNSPCRSNEVFDIVDDINVHIKTLEYSNGKLNIDIAIFDSTNNRITILNDSVTQKSGYIHYKPSVSNSDNKGTILYSEDKKVDKYIKLFQYRVDNNNIVNLIGNTDNMNIIPFDASQYRSMSKGSTLATNSARYVSNDTQAVCIVGTQWQFMVYLNGKKVMGNTQNLNHNKRHCILYLKPDDVITGTYSSIFKINYNI